MRRFIEACLILTPALIQAQQPPGGAPPVRRSVTGTYATPARIESGCILKVVQVSPKRIHFQLFCDRGPPAHNTGTLVDTIAIVGQVAIYRTSEWGSACEIRMRFARDQVEVSQTGSNGACGFGNGVYSDGTYRLVSRHTPVIDDSP